jgi:outer membrane beta-barrel protein
MKRSMQFLSSAVLAASLVAGMCAVSIAQSDDEKASGAQTAPDLNRRHVLTEKKVRLSGGDNNVVRSGPGNTFAIVGVYPNGSEFVVIAKRGEWYNIRLSDTNTGWIHSSLCKEFDDMSDLEFRPNPRLFSRIGSFAFTAYAGGYAFDRKSNSLVLGGRFGYHVLEFLEVEGDLGWTHVVRPAEIVESLFNLRLEEENFHLLFYSFNTNVMLLPGRQMVPFLTVGTGSAIMQGQTETSFNYGAGINFFVKQNVAVRFEFRGYRFKFDSPNGRENTNLEFSVGNTFCF